MAEKKSNFLSKIFHKEDKQKEEAQPFYFDYKFIIFLVFILFVLAQAFFPRLISPIPIIGPYMAAVANLYNIGAAVIGGNAGVLTTMNFIVTFIMVFLPPFLLYVAFMAFRTLKGVARYILPIVIFLIVAQLLLYFLG
ncbi:hypothetical protein ACFLQI_02010 [Candidatus Undinarchaeota archaeon]